LCQQLGGYGGHSLRGKVSWEEVDVVTGVVRGTITIQAEYKDRHIGDAGAYLCYKCRTADSHCMVSGDNQAELPGETVLLDEAKSLSGVVDAAHCSGLPPKERHYEIRLKRVVIDQENRCHSALVSRSTLYKRTDPTS
jgi:hypothetical protein